MFDTGDSYGTGRLNGQRLCQCVQLSLLTSKHSEKLLGKFMEEYARQNGGVYPNIGTKFASYPWRLTVGRNVSFRLM